MDGAMGLSQRQPAKGCQVQTKKGGMQNKAEEHGDELNNNTFRFIVKHKFARQGLSIYTNLIRCPCPILTINQACSNRRCVEVES